MAMVTVTTLKQYLPEITGTTANTDLEALLDRVEAATARYMGWRKPDNLASPRKISFLHCECYNFLYSLEH